MSTSPSWMSLMFLLQHCCQHYGPWGCSLDVASRKNDPRLKWRIVWMARKEPREGLSLLACMLKGPSGRMSFGKMRENLKFFGGKKPALWKQSFQRKEQYPYWICFAAQFWWTPRISEFTVKMYHVMFFNLLCFYFLSVSNPWGVMRSVHITAQYHHLAF